MEKAHKQPRNLKTRLISGFTTLLLLLAVVGCLFVVLQSLSKGYVEIGGSSVFRVVTGSMEPHIPVGALLVSRQADIDQIQEDDIVCFRSKEPGLQGMIITHRVVRVLTAPDGSPMLQTQGDSNLVVDVHYVTDDNLIGRVIWHTGDESVMAGMIQFLTGDFGFLACVVLPVILVAVWIFRDAAKSLRKEILRVEQQLEQKESVGGEKTLTEEEYAQLYHQLEEEVRKEMEQHAEQSVEDSESAMADAETGDGTADEASVADDAEEDTAAPSIGG